MVGRGFGIRDSGFGDLGSLGRGSLGFCWQAGGAVPRSEGAPDETGAPGTAIARLLPALLPFLLVAVPVPADCPRRSAVEAFLTGDVAVPGQPGAGRQPVPL
ncbi:hypothetical protein BXOR1_16500 [Xanthomonas oryzae pv. oryzicola]|nr:hypothetical protein FE36_14505 [Xanthomonas oryzae pv. oryzicola]AKO00068.1 hypothetical protein ACU15_05645 [Xanthomonas oryzae pv. oryzicola]AKO20742.1 hypothetical protein ACU11_15965 [Xanthomonas oryzae pv. oryzicola]OLK86979.1 hypothetical protein BXOR1_16500 [Xanthomonas oryzae pv. oryzicola]QEO96342.1 hypothetical protein XOCgx_1349 [Xanthomonas oryzae pv. oryzicola]